MVWHTQGSGKSLTMLWLATKLRRSPALRNPTVVVVTDRTQLDAQISRTFRDASVLEPERADSTRQLRELLRTSSGRTVMTTIQKFEEVLDAPTGDLPHLNDADNVVVMIDEAHRTQYGRLASKMRAALPNATFLGFTGTPIDHGFRRTTLGVFGGLIDSYTIPQSVEDGATVPIYYEARLPDLHVGGPETLDRLFDALFGEEPEETRAEIRRRYANRERIAQAAKRIEAIALDIAEHFKAKIQPNGFKAQVVVPSREAALRYAEHLTTFGFPAYPVITTTNNDGPEFQLARDLNEDEIVGAFTDPDGEPQILVVVDKLITGFDAPVEQVLYLDRAIREHTLLQAIARVNRPYSRTRDGVTTEKQHGLVVDYHGVSRELESALAIFDHGDVQEALKELPEDPGPAIQAAADQAESHFRGLDLDDPWACVHHFDADADTDGDYKADAYEHFDCDYREFSTLMDRFLPDAAASAYLDRLRRLTVIRSYARAVFLRERADIDWTAVGAKVLPGGAEARAERRKASVRAKAEHPFLYVKRHFGYAKVRTGVLRRTASVSSCCSASRTCCEPSLNSCDRGSGASGIARAGDPAVESGRDRPLNRGIGPRSAARYADRPAPRPIRHLFRPSLAVWTQAYAPTADGSERVCWCTGLAPLVVTQHLDRPSRPQLVASP